MEFDATFIVSIISFIVFVLIMNKILYAPILDIIEKRRSYFDENKNEAIKNNEETDSLNQKYDEKLSKAHKNSREITSSGFQNAKNKKDEIIKNAKNSINEEIKEKLNHIEEEKDNTNNELNTQTDSLSDLMISKLLGGKDV